VIHLSFKPYLQELLLYVRATLNSAFDAKWNRDPFGSNVWGTREDYLLLFESTRSKSYPELDRVEAEIGWAIDKSWLDDLALHTQIVKKESDLGYPHGRLLYTLLRDFIIRNAHPFVNIVETGTARGFSAVCMSKAISDAGIDGRIITIDVLNHLRRQIWNCIDDLSGPKSRAEILEPWFVYLQRILFLQGDSLDTLPRVGIGRIHFAFLDAQHTRRSVMEEFRIISSRQQRGDVIVFDDVTPAVFPGVVAAVDEIIRQGDYEVKHLNLTEQRAFAWAVRL
jgi:predicted O-methyltransferase YrrM